MKIFGIQIEKYNPKREAENLKWVVDSVMNDLVQKSGSWDKLFLLGQQMKLFRDKVETPYQQVASVYKAVKAICDNVPQAKISFYNRKTGKEITDDSVKEFRLLFDNPNPRQSGNDFIQEWVGFYALYGEGFIKKISSIGALINPASKKLPAQIVNLNPKQMQEVVDAATTLVTKWNYAGRVEVSPDELIHTKDFNPYNPHRGMPPLSPIDDEIFIDQSTLDYNKQFFGNDATPNFVLSTEKGLSDDVRARLEKWWKERHQGVKNAFKPSILEGGLKAQTIANTHKEMDFVEQKRLMREEILGIWRAPKALFNITDDLNYATFMGQMKVFWIYALMPIMRKFEDSMNRNLIWTMRDDIQLAFDLRNVPAFQEDFKDKVDTAQKLWTMGFTADEINEKLELGFTTEEWRKHWWIGFGQVPADRVLEDPAGLGAPGTQDDDSKDTGSEKGEGKSPSLDTRKQIIAKVFIGRQSSLEKLMFGKIKRYIYTLRNELLHLDDEKLAHGIVDINWERKDEELLKLVEPLLLEGLRQGVDLGREALGEKKGIADDIIEQRLQSYLKVSGQKITGVNRTIKRQIADTIAEAVHEGETVAGAARDILDISGSVRSAMKEFFNSASARALTIARTESTGAVNAGSLIYYQENDVKGKSWSTSGDENVRESHRHCEDQGIVKMDKPFSNGLMYPGDQSGDAGEVINCRCVLVPEVE